MITILRTHRIGSKFYDLKELATTPESGTEPFNQQELGAFLKKLKSMNLEPVLNLQPLSNFFETKRIRRCHIHQILHWNSLL